MRHHNILTVLVARDMNTENVYYMNGILISLERASEMILHANSTQIISTEYMDGYTIFNHQISF